MDVEEAGDLITRKLNESEFNEIGSGVEDFINRLSKYLKVVIKTGQAY